MEKLLNYIPYLFLKISIAVVKWIPFSLLYLIADSIFFLLFYIIKYRKKVVSKNLEIALPECSPYEKKQIIKYFYRNFCDILIESVKGFSLNEKELKKRYQYFNTEMIDAYFKEGQSVILVGSHFANWEWGVLSVSLWLEHTVIGVYKPVKNKIVDRYLNALRKKWGLELAEMKNTGRAIIRNKNRNIAFVLIADQSPSDLTNAHWVPFFQRETPFLHGPGKIAQLTGYPVFIFDIKRVKRGYYHVHFNPLELNPKSADPQSITKKFAMHLEQYIQKNPSDWLWSHRRWKRSKVLTPGV